MSDDEFIQMCEKNLSEITNRYLNDKKIGSNIGSSHYAANNS